MHPVKSITFVIPDPDDRKIFGYVFSQPDCSTGHKFYALKSENVRGTKKKLFALLNEIQKMHWLVVGDVMHGLGLRHVLFTVLCYYWDLMSHTRNVSLC